MKYNSGMTIDAYQKALAEKKANPVDWWHSCAARIKQCEPDINAWESLAEGPPSLNSDSTDKPLFGVPVGIKDILDTASFPTSWGTKGYLRSQASLLDAALVTLLQELGALVMGKTVSTEFAYFTPGKTKNPHDLSRTPGGSSSGSAAAVAARMVPLTFGTQTAGSIIRPASYCGVFGFKPTFNTLSTSGVKSFAPSLDTLGWYANYIEDICTAFSALTRAGKISPRNDLTGVRVGINSLPGSMTMSADVKNAIAEAQSALEQAGAEIVPLVLDDSYEKLVEQQKIVMAYEAAQTLGSEYSTLSEHLGPELVALIQDGQSISYTRYREAMLATASAQQTISAIFNSQADVILAASSTGEAPQGLDFTGDPVYCRAWTLLGVPCINLPISHGMSGMPVGVQLIADRWQDQQLLEIAYTLMPKNSSQHE
ncbi:amidase [Granulosicoccus sp. 3-233]|uniref:amidase n=1 Tax=Granulosicoccus sp. 3-233 TaxID=3417969 RepID=UPI003D351E38